MRVTWGWGVAGKVMFSLEQFHCTHLYQQKCSYFLWKSDRRKHTISVKNIWVYRIFLMYIYCFNNWLWFCCYASKVLKSLERMPKMPFLNLSHCIFGILNCVLLPLIMLVITIHVKTNVNTCNHGNTRHVSGFLLCSICALRKPHLSNGDSRV